MEELAGVADHVIPLEGRTRIHLVGLDVKMADNALVNLKISIRQLLEDEIAGGIPRIVAFNLRERFAERGREFDQSLVLLGREIVLHQIFALDRAGDGFRTRRVADEILGVNATIAILGWNGDARLAVRVFGIPFRKGILAACRVGAHVGDFNADGAAVRGGRVPSAFLKVERLVDRAVQVEHELDAKTAHVVQYLEALPARAAHVKVDDELIHDPLEERQIPAAAAHTLDLLATQAAAAQVVASRTIEAPDFRLRGFPIGFFDGAEATSDAIGVVAARVHPEHHASAGVHELAGDDDFIPFSVRESAGPGRGLAAGKQGRREQRAEDLDRTGVT